MADIIPFCESINAILLSKWSQTLPVQHLYGPTLLADYICDTNFKHSLDEIAIREFGFKPDKFTDIVKKGETFSSIDILVNCAGVFPVKLLSDSTIDDVVPGTAGQTNFDMIIQGRRSSSGLG